MGPSDLDLERVANKIIDQLKKGTSPLQRSWKSGGGQILPFNVVSGKRYRGGNIMHLMSQDHNDPRWMTSRQAESMGARIRKGEPGTQICFWKFHEEVDKLDEQGRPVYDKNGNHVKVNARLENPEVFHYTVFNAEQIDGLSRYQERPIAWSPLDRAKGILEGSGAVIRHYGDKAFYDRRNDVIVMPNKDRFFSEDKYYAVALYELAQWAGHPSRLDRGPHGGDYYAREELRTEIASMILGRELGIGRDPKHINVARVAGWIGALKEDPAEIFRAAADAENIRDYILSFDPYLALEQRGHESRNRHGPERNRASKSRMENTKGVDRHVDVPYRDKEAARTLGTRWDRQGQSSFVPPGIDMAPFDRWARKADGAPRGVPVVPNHKNVAVPHEGRRNAKATTVPAGVAERRVNENRPQKARYLVSVSYSKWTSNDKEIGEPGERGMELDREVLGLDDLKRCIEHYGFTRASSSNPEVGKTWFSSSSPRKDREHFELGIDTYFGLHVHEVNGHAPTPDDYRQIANMITARLRGPRPELMGSYRGFSPA